MDKFIDRQKLEAHFSPAITGKDAYTAGEVLLSIQKFPSADVAPVVHAEWKVNEHIELDFCSNCLEPVRRYVTAGQMDRSNYKGETFWNYCPHCGAKMDGKEGKE